MRFPQDLLICVQIWQKNYSVFVSPGVENVQIKVPEYVLLFSSDILAEISLGDAPHWQNI